jgi:hypothetical protein
VETNEKEVVAAIEILLQLKTPFASRLLDILIFKTDETIISSVLPKITNIATLAKIYRNVAD